MLCLGSVRVDKGERRCALVKATHSLLTLESITSRDRWIGPILRLDASILRTLEHPVNTTTRAIRKKFVFDDRPHHISIRTPLKQQQPCLSFKPTTATGPAMSSSSASTMAIASKPHAHSIMSPLNSGSPLRMPLHLHHRLH